MPIKCISYIEDLEYSMNPLKTKSSKEIFMKTKILMSSISKGFSFLPPIKKMVVV